MTTLNQHNNAINVPAELISKPPTFVGIGAQKAGTSWIHNCIMQHPDCYFPEFLSKQISKQHKIKEHHFFDQFSFQEMTKSDIHNYHNWCARPKNKITGEWTPSYLSDPWVPRLLKLAAPETKILLILRDPIERYISGLSFSQRADKRLQANAELVNIDHNNYHQINRRTATDHFYRGLYNMHLSRWRRYFSDSSILVVQYEKLVKDPKSHLKAIFKHIGLDHTYDVPDEIINKRLKYVNANQKIPLSNKHRHSLISEYQDDINSLITMEKNIEIDLWQNFTATSY